MRNEKPYVLGAMSANAKILIVEDEGNARQALVDYFRFGGYEVRYAATETDAVAIGREFAPQVLISDWVLDGDGEGVAVARVLSEINRDLAIILFSGFPLNVLKERSKGIPVSCFIEKPVSLTALSQAVERALANSGSRPAAG